MNRIVVAVTERPEGAAALTWAAERARAGGGELDVVFVVGDTPASPVHVTAATRAAAVRTAEAAGVPARLHDPAPDVAEQLLALAHDGADVVVLGVRRRSATMKFLLGSIAQRVIGEAPCPVVTVKAP